MFCSYVTKNEKPFSATAHAAAIKAAHDNLRILCNKVTHGGRVYGRQQLEQAGVDKVSSDVAGGWSVGAGEGCYGNGLSNPAMRAMAGFPHDDKVFYLPRASLEPPQYLQQQIFPELDEWIERHTEGIDCDRNFALNGYFRLLKWLRVVIIQDAAVLIINGVEHNILFNHSIFKSNEFLAFMAQVQEVLETQANPLHKEIERVLPELCRQINNNTNILKDQIISTVIKCSDNIQQQLQTELTASHRNIGCVVKRLQDAVSTCLQDAVKVRDRFACHCITLLHAINKK